MIRPRVLLDVLLTLGLGAVLAELLWIEAKLSELEIGLHNHVVGADEAGWGEHPFGTQG